MKTAKTLKKETLNTLDPEINYPSELDDLTHSEIVEIYRDASANIRFAKSQQWKTVLYFSGGTAAVTGYGELTNWADPILSQYLLIIIWIFSGASVLTVLGLQWWQAAEHRKIEYGATKWSTFANTMRARKSSLVSDLQRYGMMLMMVLYLELVTIAVTRALNLGLCCLRFDPVAFCRLGCVNCLPTPPV